MDDELAAAKRHAQTLLRRLRTVEADKAKLEQTYYDQHFAHPDEVPSLRPYPRLAVDLGIAEGCTEFCHQHRRRLIVRMPTAFMRQVMAILDLSEYESAAAYSAAVGKASKGNVLREARKASAAGLACRLFDPFDHAADIQAIFDSKPER